MSEASIYLFKTLTDIISVAVLLTLFFRLLKVDYYNPIVLGMIRVTDFFVSPVSKIIKPIYSLDVSRLFIVIFLQAFAYYLAYLAGSVELNVVTMGLWALFSTLLLGLRILWWSLLVGIIISWVAPMSSHPAISLIQQMSNQICKPFRVFLPPMGGLDFSPILAFVILQFLLIALRNLSLDSGLPISLSVGF